MNKYICEKQFLTDHLFTELRLISINFISSRINNFINIFIMMIVFFFIVIAAVNAINFHSVLESVDAECPKPCPECEWATLLLDGMHKLHATIDKVSFFVLLQ